MSDIVTPSVSAPPSAQPAGPAILSRPPVPAVRATVDVAVWFLDRARADDVPLALQKLQRLLFVAHGLYGAAERATGGLLMPAVFVADELGPIEPNLQRLLCDGRPSDLAIEPPSTRVAAFLEDVWRRFGPMPIDRLNAVAARHPAVVAAQAAGRGAVIDGAALAAGFVASLPKPADGPRILRNHAGAPVAVSAWRPGALKSPAKPDPAKAG